MNETHTTALILALCTIIVLIFYLCELVAQTRIAILVANNDAKKRDLNRGFGKIHDPIER